MAPRGLYWATLDSSFSSGDKIWVVDEGMQACSEAVTASEGGMNFIGAFSQSTLPRNALRQ